MLVKQRDAAGLTLFSDQIKLHTQTKSTSQHLQYLYGNLEKQLQQPVPGEEREETAIADVLHKIAERIHKRSLVVLFTDMFDTREDQDKLFAALQHLRHNKHEVILFHTVDARTEFNFEFENRPYKFIDMESGKELKLNPKEIKQEYLKRIEEFRKELKLRCGQYKIEYVETDVQKGFDQILLPYFLKRKKMF
jgi:uncharacterized protein (DUF58 family)